MRRLSRSTQRRVARSNRGDVDANRNVTTYVPVDWVRRHSGAVMTLPISVTLVSNMLVSPRGLPGTSARIHRPPVGAPRVPRRTVDSEGACVHPPGPRRAVTY